MGNFNSFIDKLDMDFWHEICAKNGKLCHYKKGEFFVQQGDVIRYMGIVKEGYFKYVVTDSKGNTLYDQSCRCNKCGGSGM